MARLLTLATELFVALLILNSCANPSAAQSKPSLSSNDAQTIIQILFDREFHGSIPQSEILLSPRLKPDWIPQSTIRRFKQLEYKDEKNVPEYYEVQLSLNRDHVDAQILKGNYCVKGGPRYRFRKQKGTWVATEIGAVESHVPVADCPACEIGSGRRYRVNKTDAPFDKPDNLALSGTVRQVECTRHKTYVICKAKVDLEFLNIATQPVIVVQPSGEYSYWHGATFVARTEAESKAAIYVDDTQAWPSIYTFPVYKWLGERLDQPAPPNDVTRIIEPGHKWLWTTTIQFSFAEGRHCDGTIGSPIGVKIGWTDIEKLSDPMWIRISFELWPFNVENFKHDLGRKLQKRWSKFGTLFLNEFDGHYSFGQITSQPIELDLRQIRLN